jgi:citronellol/citronellal dehydrogenase
VKEAVEKTIKKFGRIDVLVNNASAINLRGTEETDMKKYELMHDIIVKGAFMMVKYCLPYLKKSENPHIINSFLDKCRPVSLSIALNYSIASPKSKFI